jgi:hypothetical protein
MWNWEENITNGTAPFSCTGPALPWSNKGNKRKTSSEAPPFSDTVLLK